MKTYRFLLLFVFALGVSLSSCTKDDDDPKGSVVSDIYILNYGTYDGTKTEFSVYDEENKQISHDAYKAANGVDFNSNAQSMSIYNGKAYVTSNNGDKIDVVDAETFVASVNPISENITKPRYFAAKGDFGYVSCWGEVTDWKVMANSYIAKIDLKTNTVAKKIPVGGGIEGVTIVDNKLYGAIYTTNKVMVMDLTTEEIEYITVSAVPQHFVQDADGNLWVSVVSTYSVPFDASVIGVDYINTTTNKVQGFVNFAGISSSGYLAISKDKKSVYVMGAEAWPGTKSSIYRIDTETQKIDANALIEGEKFYGMGYNPVSDKIYALISPSTTEAGTIKVYSSTGDLEDTQTSGVAPQHVVFNVK